MAQDTIFEGLSIFFVIDLHAVACFLSLLFCLFLFEYQAAAFLEIGTVGIFGNDAKHHSQNIAYEPYQHPERIFGIFPPYFLKGLVFKMLSFCFKTLGTFIFSTFFFTLLLFPFVSGGHSGGILLYLRNRFGKGLFLDVLFLFHAFGFSQFGDDHLFFLTDTDTFQLGGLFQITLPLFLG